MKSILGLMFVGFLLAFCGLSVPAAEGKVTLATLDFPPYCGKDLENNGFISEIITEAFKRSGYEVEIKIYPWKRGVDMLKAGKVDGLFTVWHTKEREEWGKFSEALPANELGIFTLKDKNVKFDSYADLKDYKIGVIDGYAYPQEFLDAKLKTYPVQSTDQNLQKLLSGKIDMFISDRLEGIYIMSKAVDKSEAEKVEWIKSISETPQYLVISHKAEDADKKLKAFNDGLAAMQKDGTVKKIMEKHGF